MITKNKMELILKGWHNTKLPDAYNQVILDLKKAYDEEDFEKADLVKIDLIKVYEKLNEVIKKKNEK